MGRRLRSEEHTSELQSHSEISYAVFCLKKKKKKNHTMIAATAGMERTDNLNLLQCFEHGVSFFFFFNDTAPPEIYTNLNTLSLHDALPIFDRPTFATGVTFAVGARNERRATAAVLRRSEEHTSELQSHSEISYAVFCL